MTVSPPATQKQQWSPLQQDIFKFIETGRGSAVITAVAGSGKTTTIVEAANRIPRNSYAAFVAFNKTIATELKERLPSHVRAMTLNAMGFTNWNRYLGNKVKLVVDANKTRSILDAMLPAEDKPLYQAALAKLVGLAKSVGIVPKGVIGATPLTWDEPSEWLALIDHYDITIEEDADIHKLLDYAREVLRRSIAMAKEVIDFDDQLYMPVIMRAKFWGNHFLFVDEAQDVNKIQRAMLKRALMPGGRLIAVGDPCQPAGTMVSVKRGGVISRVPIETIVKGDKVVSYIRHGSYFNYETVTHASERVYAGRMYAVQVGATKISRYTSNHWCFVNHKPLADKYCTYIMKKGQSFRVGMCKMGYAQAVGPIQRMKQEGGDAVWVLRVYDDKQDALLGELIASYSFSLPTVTFKPVNALGVNLDEETLDLFWQGVNNKTSAEDCLRQAGRDPEYPFSVPEDRWEVSMRRPSITRACNLLQGCLMLPYNGKVHQKAEAWEELRLWTYDNVNQKVYSLEVSNTNLYVADGLVTHNCQAIYGFRGASNDGIQLIKKEFGAIELPLSISYRCPKAVVTFAQQYVTHIQSAPTAPDGKVTFMTGYCEKDFHPEDMVICRNTAPLIQLAYKLIRKRTPCRVLGREIGQGLVALIEKMKAKTVETLVKRLQDHASKESAGFMAKGQEQKADALNDKVETVLVFVEQVQLLHKKDQTIAKLKETIESLFSENAFDRSMLTLCTIHKAKGLEAQRVFILEWSLCPSKYARQQWQQQQETNLQYVAVTRAKSELAFIELDSFGVAPTEV